MVHFEDFFNGVDIGCCPEVQPKVILVGCAHDLLKGGKMSSVNEQSNAKASLHKHFIQTNLLYMVFEGHQNTGNLDADQPKPHVLGVVNDQELEMHFACVLISNSETNESNNST